MGNLTQSLTLNKRGIKGLRSMIAAEREMIILENLDVCGVLTTSELVALTHSSESTLRRDLQRLEDSGRLQRTHGGARALIMEGPQSIANEMIQSVSHSDEKSAIATKAATFVRQGDTVFLGAGQTCAILAREIRTIPNLTIVTTSITAVLELIEVPDNPILLLGGDINVGASHIETLDEGTVESVKKYHFDHAFITVDGIDMDFGYSINSRRQIALYEHLRANSEDFVVLADNSKFGRRAFTRFSSLEGVPRVVADEKLKPAYMSALVSAGTDVALAML